MRSPMLIKVRQFQKAVVARSVALALKVAVCLSLICWFQTPGNACGIDQLTDQQAQLLQQVNVNQQMRDSQNVISAQLTAQPLRRSERAEHSAGTTCPYILAEELVIQSATAIGNEVPTAESVVLSLFD